MVKIAIIIDPEGHIFFCILFHFIFWENNYVSFLPSYSKYGYKCDKLGKYSVLTHFNRRTLEEEVTRMSFPPAFLPEQSPFPAYCWKMSWHLRGTSAGVNTPLQLVPALALAWKLSLLLSQNVPLWLPHSGSFSAHCIFFSRAHFSKFLNFYISSVEMLLFLYRPLKCVNPARDTRCPKGLSSTLVRVDRLLATAHHSPINHSFPLFNHWRLLSAKRWQSVIPISVKTCF